MNNYNRTTTTVRYKRDNLSFIYFVLLLCLIFSVIGFVGAIMFFSYLDDIKKINSLVSSNSNVST